MASLIQNLIEVLEAETGCYKQLLDMADNKTDVIIKGDVPSLQEITQDEQVVAGHILRLEKQRQENLKDIALVTNKKEADLTVKRMIDMLKGEEQRRLTEVSDQLEAVLEKFKVKQDQNRALIEQALEFVDYTMNAVQSMRTIPEGHNYQGQGGHAGAYNQKHFFDTKQ